MVATLNVNPMQTTNAAGSFRTLSDGFIQGVAMDDPATGWSLTTVPRRRTPAISVG